MMIIIRKHNITNGRSKLVDEHQRNHAM